MKRVIIESEKQKTLVYNLVSEMPCDGSFEVITKKVDKKMTTRQRNLWFVWATDVSRSGLGQHDTVDSVHAAAKWQFVRPIMLRDNELFGIIYNQLMETVIGSAAYSEICQAFARDYISTEKLNRHQRAESLTMFKEFWAGKGVNLSDPDEFGKNLLKYR